MPTVYGPDNYTCVVHQTSTIATDGEAITVLGLIAIDPISPSDMAAQVRDAWVEHILPEQSSAVSLGLVEVYNATVVGTALGASVGTAGEDMLPSSTAALVQKLTPVRGRRGRGRWYLFDVLDEDNVFSDGSLTEELQLSLQTAVSGFLNELESNQIGLAIPQGSVGTSPPIIPWPRITNLRVDGVAATQRRRMRR